MFYTIYKISNKINGKYYIGKHQTQNLNDNYFGSGKLIQAAIKKYGIDNFTKDILHIFDNEDDMNAKEKELVIISEQTYNLCEGGRGGFSYINKNGLAFGGNQKEASIKGNLSEKRKDPNYKKKAGVGFSYINKNGLAFGGNPKEASIKGINILREKWKDPNYRKKRIAKLSEKQHQQGSKNSQYGTCWITNGQKSIKIKKEELDIWLEKGYTKGRK